MIRYFVLVAVMSQFAVGCAHMRVESEPGTEISINGMPMGPAPVSYQVENRMDDIVVTAKKGDKTNTIAIQRTGTNMELMAAYTGFGVLVCCTTGFFPALLVPVVGYFFARIPPPVVFVSADPRASRGSGYPPSAYPGGTRY